MVKNIRVLWMVATVFAVGAGDALARGDMDAGRREFNFSCRSCHSLTRGEVLEGPSLAGIFGRRAGSLMEYNYSETMRNANIIWTEDSLDEYLASPLTSMGSGIDMMAHGVSNDEDRADLIEFLKHAL